MIGMTRVTSVIKPKPLAAGATIGLFTPSWPAHVHLREKYLHSLEELEGIGFHYQEGFLTKNLKSHGYRSADPKSRAQEFMELITNPRVDCLMATIGGWNSSSMIPYLDFDEIKKQRKVICGYSDITALHMAIHKYSRLVTIMGPCLVPTFGEYPHILPYSLDSFLMVTSLQGFENRMLTQPPIYSTQFVDATKQGWRAIESHREYRKNEGWHILNEGKSTGKLIVANLETLLSLAGTPVFPDVREKILVLEEEEANIHIQERSFNQLLLMGVFDQIGGLVISKPFVFNNDAEFSFEHLIMEIVGKRKYPILTNFDCGHTFPSLALPIGIEATLEVSHRSGVIFTLNEVAVEA
jgi:muramoyltetrapeptide carboxypeptidase LdcA involved in peptidoglycan recycling